jgi:hypothetical protein
VRRVAFAAALAAGALAALVAVGRWEGDRHADEENREIAAVVALVGRLDDPSLDAYRVLPDFDCLLYRRGEDPFALELCVDRAGRVVEAIDRRGGEPRVASLREEPTVAAVRLDRGIVDGLLDRMGAPGTR